MEMFYGDPVKAVVELNWVGSFIYRKAFFPETKFIEMKDDFVADTIFKIAGKGWINFSEPFYGKEIPGGQSPVKQTYKKKTEIMKNVSHPKKYLTKCTN